MITGENEIMDLDVAAFEALRSLCFICGSKRMDLALRLQNNNFAHSSTWLVNLLTTLEIHNNTLVQSMSRSFIGKSLAVQPSNLPLGEVAAKQLLLRAANKTSQALLLFFGFAVCLSGLGDDRHSLVNRGLLIHHTSKPSN